MKRKAPSKSAAFYENNSWYHRTKTLQQDGTTSYSKKGGFQTEKEANISHARNEAEFQDACRKYQLSHQINKDMMLKDYLIYWFQEVYSQRVESTTKVVCAYVIQDLILPQLEYDIKVRYVNTEYLDTILEKASKITDSSGNKAREVLNIAFKDAVIEGFIKDNPITGTKMYKRKPPKVLVLSKGRIRTLLEGAVSTNWYLEILLALFCGLRKGEIQGLKFSDFDLVEETVTVNRQLVSDAVMDQEDCFQVEMYSREERDPKSDNGLRTLRVPEIILTELEKRRAWVEYNKNIQGEKYLDLGYISCQENGKPRGVSSINGALTKICNRTALPHITPHGLRHMFATILLEAGVPLIKISAMLGHRSIHTTFEYYCEVMDEFGNILSFMNRVFAPGEREEAS